MGLIAILRAVDGAGGQLQSIGMEPSAGRNGRGSGRQIAGGGIARDRGNRIGTPDKENDLDSTEAFEYFSGVKSNGWAISSGG